MNRIIAITKALADENRIRVLLALDGQELCVCQIVELLDLAPSTVSKHISILKRAWLLESRKEGRWMYYRLAGKESPSEARKAVEWVRGALARDKGRLKDKNRLRRILKIDPEVLCRTQNRN